jgi:hypothetical protein
MTTAFNILHNLRIEPPFSDIDRIGLFLAAESADRLLRAFSMPPILIEKAGRNAGEEKPI